MKSGTAAKPGMKLLIFIFPVLFLVLIVTLIFRFAPVYQEKQQEIREYNLMAEKYRPVEFIFYEDRRNPVLNDKRYKNYKEKGKFVREYKKLSEEIKSSLGLEKARKLYDYLISKYKDKKDYVSRDHCIMYLAKDSTYNNPSFKSLSQEKMEREKYPWIIREYPDNRFFKQHILIQFAFDDWFFEDNNSERSFKDTDAISASRFVALDKRTFVGYELSDNWGDWVKFNRAKFRIVDKSEYDALDTHGKKIEEFNRVAENEEILIDSRDKAEEYIEFFIFVYYYGSGSILKIKNQEHYIGSYIKRWNEKYLGSKSFEISDKGKYFEVKFSTDAIRYTIYGLDVDGNNFIELARWNVKLYRNGTLQANKDIKAGGTEDEMGKFNYDTMEEFNKLPPVP